MAVFPSTCHFKANSSRDWGVLFDIAVGLRFFKCCWNLFSLFCSRFVYVLKFSLVCFKKQISIKETPKSLCRLTEQIWQSTGLTSGLPLKPDTREWSRGNAGEGSLCLLSGTKIGISKSGMHPDSRGFAHTLHSWLEKDSWAIITWISMSHKGYLLQMGL